MYNKGDLVILLECTHWKNSKDKTSKWCQITKPCIGQITEVVTVPTPEWPRYNFPSDKAICLVRNPRTGYET